MEEYDSDLDHARKLRQRLKDKQDKDFSKLLNKKDLNSFEMDQMFSDSD